MIDGSGPSWKQFEIAVHQHCDRIARKEGGSAEYDVKLECSDGDYQMDVVIRLPSPPPIGEIVVLVDAKDRERVSRDDVLLLVSKIAKCDADVGVIIASGRDGFQKGARRSAESDRIRLWTLIDGRLDELKFELPKPGQVPRRPTARDLKPAIVTDTDTGWSVHRPDEIQAFVDDLRSAAI